MQVKQQVAVNHQPSSRPVVDCLYSRKHLLLLLCGAFVLFLPSVLLAEVPPLNAQYVLSIPLEEGNPRNSEGSIVLLKNGDLLFIYTHFSGKRGGDHDTARLDSRRSSDGGKTWTQQDQTVLHNEGKMNIMSVSLLRLASGEIAMFYLVKEHPGDCRPYMRLSTDEGKTWGPRILCIPDESYNVVNNDRIIQLESGRILMPVACHAYYGKNAYDYDWNAETFCMYSDDKGKTWKKSHAVERQKTTFQEPGLVVLADGKILMYIRTNMDCQYYSISSDGGETWSPAVPSCLDSPLSPAQIKRIPGSDRLLAVWNPLTPSKKRSGMDVAVLSPDASKVIARKYIEKTDKNNFQYPHILFVDSNNVLVGYFTFGGNYHIIRFNMSQAGFTDEQLGTKSASK